MTLLLFACTSISLHDNTQLGLNLTGEPVLLASPYVLGAQFELHLDGPAAEISDYDLVSQDAGVLSLGRGELEDYGDNDSVVLSFPASAVGVGTTVLVVIDGNGEEVLRGTAEVAAPDRFELFSATDLEIQSDPSPVAQPVVYVGGQAAFRVDFFLGDTQLAGARGLSVVSSNSTLVTPDDTSFSEDADWLVVEPSRAGEFSVSLSTGGVEVGEVALSAVKANSVARIDVSREPESDALEGDPLDVVALAETAEGTRVYGVPFTWLEDGQPFDQTGDKYVYEYDPDVTTTVTAEGAGRVIQLEVHGQGRVYDTNSVACAVANVGPVAPAILLGLLGLRRRRAVSR